MRSIRLPLSLFLPFLLLSCQGPVSVEKLNQELLKTDRAFSEMSRREGMNHAFTSYCDPEGVLLRPDSYPIKGKEEITALLMSTNDTTIQLTWEPLFAMGAESGELGYTYGTYLLRIKGSDQEQQGTYVTIWRKGKEGWKFLLDSGNEGLGD
jgi:ketosteroid isomerase-like protein